VQSADIQKGNLTLQLTLLFNLQQYFHLFEWQRFSCVFETKAKCVALISSGLNTYPPYTNAWSGNGKHSLINYMRISFRNVTNGVYHTIYCEWSLWLPNMDSPISRSSSTGRVLEQVSGLRVRSTSLTRNRNAVVAAASRKRWKMTHNN
jgi:hypothetical protein